MKRFSIRVSPLYLDKIGAWLHGARPVVPPLSDSQVSHQQVRGQMAGSEGKIGGLQQREARHTAGIGLPLPQSQPISMEPPAGVQ